MSAMHQWQGDAPAPLSPYARKYGLSDSDQVPLLAGLNTSGVAPRLSNPTNKMEYLLEMAWETSQREQLHGFTTQELYDLGAHGRNNIKPSNLGGPIHPVFDRDTQWVSTLVEHDIEGAYGLWDISNDDIWNVLEPVFRLSTRFIESAYLHPWFTALMYGELRPIEDSRFGGGINTGYPEYYVSFHNVQEEYPHIEVAEKWAEVTENVKFALGVAMEPNVRARTKGAVNRNCGYLPDIRGVFEPGQSRIELNIRIIEPLLHDLTVSERLITQFLVAKTVVHELCRLLGETDKLIFEGRKHSIGHLRRPDIPDNPTPPPPGERERVAEKFFYEDEFYVELGFSFENAIFGGTLREVVPTAIYGHDKTRTDLSFPPLAAIMVGWPDYSKIFAADKKARSKGFASQTKIPALRVQQHSPLTFSDLSHPIHLSYIEDIQQEGYWQSCVPKWGADMTKIYPKIFSIRDYRDPSNPQDGLPLHRHFGGRISVEAALDKARFPNDRSDEQVRALCLRRWAVVKDLCNTMRQRRDMRKITEQRFGPMSYWDPDSPAGDTLPIIDNEDVMRDAIAEALGIERDELDPEINTEFLVNYFFLSPMVPPEKSVDIGSMMLDFTSRVDTQFNVEQFLQFPEEDVDDFIRFTLREWGYPDWFKWSEFQGSYQNVRAARRREREAFEERRRQREARYNSRRDDDHEDDSIGGSGFGDFGIFGKRRRLFRVSQRKQVRKEDIGRVKATGTEVAARPSIGRPRFPPRQKSQVSSGRDPGLSLTDIHHRLLDIARMRMRRMMG